MNLALNKIFYRLKSKKNNFTFYTYKIKFGLEN